MFEREGHERSDALNRALAAYLAAVAGYVNSAGLVLVGSFTSHVTGNVGRLANDVVAGGTDAAVGAASLLAAFAVGAFVASVIIEADALGRRGRSYGAALALEALLLGTFTLATTVATTTHPRWQDVEALALCAAMGVQNSLVTRLSGAVVRTTHLTGVVTDLAIEGALWFRWWRGTLSETFRLRLAVARRPLARPSRTKVLLLSTIAGSFVVGSIVGAAAAVAWRALAMLVPFVAVAAGAVYAIAAPKRPSAA